MAGGKSEGLSQRTIIDMGDVTLLEGGGILLLANVVHFREATECQGVEGMHRPSPLTH